MTDPKSDLIRAHALFASLIQGALQAHHVGPLPVPVPMGDLRWKATIGREDDGSIGIAIECPSPGEDFYGTLHKRNFSTALLFQEMEDMVASLYLTLTERANPALQPLLEYLPVNPRSLESAQKDRAQVLDILTASSLFSPSRAPTFEG